MKDQPDCDLRNNCKHVERAKQEAREKERVAHYITELVIVFAVVVTMALAWQGP